ncbi:MAG: hypothetical protein FWC53_03415 [Firmicutes bacterium]|nr:hypothetical protein [Bacillota bacterium]
METKWTESQLKAIRTSGNNILVAAAARKRQNSSACPEGCGKNYQRQN